MDLDQQVEAFVEAYRAVYLRFHTRTTPETYTPSPESLAVLRHLSQSGPLLVSEACVHFNRSQAATSDIFKRLEKRQLVKRKSDARDRRRTMVWLTDAGLKALRDSEKVLSTERLITAMSRLHQEERETLIEAMRKLGESNE